MMADAYDVIVVGSGAAGSMAAYALTLRGARVCMLEAGRHYDPVLETPMWGMDKDAPLRAARTPDKPFGYYDATVDGGWDVPGEPYLSQPDTDFRWFRARMLGGRTNHWGRVSLRLADHDFKAASHDGIGVDWPFGYDEIAPWYDKTEQVVGITGTADGLADAPDSPAGILHEPPPPRAHELLVMEGGRKLGRPVVASHIAVITRPTNGRPPCIYATPCRRGCSIAANFQSTTVLIPPAIASGHLDIVTDAMVYEVEIGSDGKATGISYVDKTLGEHRTVSGRTIVLGASAMESVRILMNSKNPRFPDGIGADDGLLGHCISDTIGSSIWAQFPALENLPPFNDFGIWYPHIYIPWWGLDEQRSGALDFARGYHIEVSGGRWDPGAETFRHFDSVSPTAWGAALKADARRYYGTFVRFAQRGETIPRRQNTVSLHPTVTDRFGIPAPRFSYQWSEHEVRQTAHAQKSMAEFIDAAGGRMLDDIPDDVRDAMSKPGEIIHEVGGARCGTSRNNSVTDPYGRVWGVPNLYVVDGAVFPTNAHKNPTLTIMAFAWRAADHIADRAGHGA
ncbi:MAG: GMC family oxidoreductase [Gammaproteobacteria bacterium]|nr:GMC family oxidoreductase [Gammaproteobacteria bacterium]MDE0454915.1 GMC family oxidoreductase [Gammaproteobacteria bacterium]